MKNIDMVGYLSQCRELPNAPSDVTISRRLLRASASIPKIPFAREFFHIAENFSKKSPASGERLIGRVRMLPYLTGLRHFCLTTL
jgi:hypothetical protein